MKIVQYPHPALRHKARPLTAIDKQVQLQAGEMLDLMNEANGPGLAALTDHHDAQTTATANAVLQPRP